MNFRLSIPRRKAIIDNLIRTQNCDILEDIIEDILQEVITPGTLAVDGGVNHGRHTRHMVHAVGANGKLISVEPLPVFMNYLEQVYGIYPQFQFVAKALYDTPNLELDFTYVRDRNTVSSLKLAAAYEGKYETETIKVNTVTIDSLLKDSPYKCNAIKLDLEGAEYIAISGAIETIKKQRPIIIYEDGKDSSAKQFGFELEPYFNLWNNNGYCLFNIFGEKLSTYEEYIAYNPWYTCALPEEKQGLQNFIISCFNARISQYL